MRSMLLDCHVHTSRHSSCCHVDPHQLCTLALERGLNGLVFTEHHYRWTRYELEQMQREFPELALYSGMEVTLGEGYDVLLLGETLPRTIAKFTPFEDLLGTLGALRDEVFLCIAHPFRYQDEIDDQLDEILGEVDGIEMNSNNIVKGQGVRTHIGILPQNFHCYESARNMYQLTPLFNSDVHWPQGIGAVANRLNVATLPETSGELVELLKNTTPTMHQDKTLLSLYLHSTGKPHPLPAE